MAEMLNVTDLNEFLIRGGVLFHTLICHPGHCKHVWPHAHYLPLLVLGRLILASTDPVGVLERLCPTHHLAWEVRVSFIQQWSRMDWLELV